MTITNADFLKMIFITFNYVVCVSTVPQRPGTWDALRTGLMSGWEPPNWELVMKTGSSIEDFHP